MLSFSKKVAKAKQSLDEGPSRGKTFVVFLIKGDSEALLARLPEGGPCLLCDPILVKNGRKS
jgi:hypothetical protein